MEMPPIVGDDSEDPDWEWIGSDGLTDKQREELTASFYEGEIFPEVADKPETPALH